MSRNKLEFFSPVDFSELLPLEMNVKIFSYLSYEEIVPITSTSQLLREIAYKSNQDYRAALRGQQILNDERLSDNERHLLTNSLLSKKYGLIMLGEEHITIKDYQGLEFYERQAIINCYGLSALREKTLTFLQMKELSVFELRMLLSLNGLIALRNGLISFSLVKEHCRGCERSHHLSAMISNNGIKFLLNGKATPNQLLEFNIQNLRELLSDNGLIAFDEELISLEQFKKMDIWNLRNALKPDVLNAAREEQQASRMLNIGY